MPGCSAYGCSNRTTKGYRLFSFPADRKLRSIWECKVSKKNWKASINAKLCGEHFESSDFELKIQDGKKILRWNVVPTKFVHRTPVKHRKLPKIRDQVVEHTTGGAPGVGTSRITRSQDQGMTSKEKKPVEVVVFHNPQKRRTPKAADADRPQEMTAESGPSKKVFFDQRKFKFDVRKLGIHGLSKKDKETAMVDLLVELGAKPPKNQCYHIREYQKIVKQKREDEKKVEALERKAGIKAKKTQTKQKKGKDDILNHVDGQVGFYKDGVQFVKRLK